MSMPARHHRHRRGPAAASIAAALSLLVALATAPVAAQQRDPEQRIGRTVADATPAGYRFETFTVDSADRNRRWRVRLAVPTGAAPAAGWPALWMLDGNAALIEFDPPLLAELAARPQPWLLVFVGYDNDLRIDSPARSRDYTPFAGERPGPGGTVVASGGGADAMLETIERAIRPEIARRVATDPARQALWGHSLAGLFALHTLYTRGGAFDTYAAGSPSLWWGEGAMLGAPEQRFVANNAGRRARLLLGLGGGERASDTSNRDLADPRVQVHLRRIAGAPPDSTARLAERLAAVDGLDVAYREFPGLTHGPMFRASLMWALHAITGVADRSGTPRPPEPPAPWARCARRLRLPAMRSTSPGRTASTAS